MSSPLCANCSRDSSRAGLGIGPVAQEDTEKQVGTGVEVICSQIEDICPVVDVASVPVVVGPVVKVRGPAVALIAVESIEVVQADTVSAVEVRGTAHKLAPPRLKTGSVDEVCCSVMKLVLLAPVFVASVIHADPGGLVGLMSEVTVSGV